MAPKFSFVIPTVRQTSLVQQCIESIWKFEPEKTKYEIVVVDDGSDVYVQNWLKDFCANNGVKLHLKDKNQGFSHTVNIGLRNALGEYLILFNNDILLIQPVLDQLERSFAVHERIGIVGAKLLYPNHTIQHAGVIRAPNSHSFIHINKHRPRHVEDVNKSGYFLAVTGALFAIKRSAYEVLGGLNENYFVACEDVEYCLRSWKHGLRVFYDHKIEAVHLEGETRGNTDASKLKKGAQWFLKEKETNAKFFNDLRAMDIHVLEGMVRSCNNEGVVESGAPKDLVKLEIGCGANPQPGYTHLDIRPLPDVEHVMDFSKDRLPYSDGQVDEILLNHVIEHVSWRKLPFIFQEWSRVLKPGGRVFLRTPDLEFICRTYIEGKMTPEWPGDEDFVLKNLSAKMTPAWWANIKLFAGQDYSDNYHFLCFDLAMIKELFERYGFERVSRVTVKPEFSPGELQVEAFKPLRAEQVKAPPKTKKILVKRRGALGDVLLTTPIVKRLRLDHGPTAIINVATDCGAVYINNPYIDAIIPANSPTAGYDHFYDLDLAYEKQPNMHIIDAYSQAVFADVKYDKSTILSVADTDRHAIDQVIQEKNIDVSRLIVAHMAVTWKNRTWSKEQWRQTFEALVADGYRVALVGSGGDFVLQGEGIVDLTKRLTIHQIAELVNRAKCFVGNDSGLMHVAGTTSTPIVGLFTCAKGELRVPFRNGEYGHSCKVIRPTADCYGCLAMEKPPVVFCDCRRGDYICLTQITPEIVVKGIRDVIRD